MAGPLLYLKLNIGKISQAYFMSLHSSLYFFSFYLRNYFPTAGQQNIWGLKLTTQNQFFYIKKVIKLKCKRRFSRLPEQMHTCPVPRAGCTCRSLCSLPPGASAAPGAPGEATALEQSQQCCNLIVPRLENVCIPCSSLMTQYHRPLQSSSVVLF